jgi:hypothetical protein
MKVHGGVIKDPPPASGNKYCAEVGFACGATLCSKQL